MKRIGLVGGLGPEATLLYYKGIHKAFKDSYSITGFPEMVIESLDLKGFTDFAEADSWDRITVRLSAACNRLLNAGADFGAICSNIPHRVFREIQEGTKLPLLSIIDAALEETVSRGIRRVGLLGTGFTMAGSFYPEAFGKGGVEIVMPGTEEQQYIHTKLFNEIELGIIRDETRKRFLEIVGRMTVENNLEGVLLACTELPLILSSGDIDIAYLDTTEIHIRAIVRKTAEN